MTKQRGKDNGKNRNHVYILYGLYDYLITRAGGKVIICFVLTLLRGQRQASPCQSIPPHVSSPHTASCNDTFSIIHFAAKSSAI